MPQITTTALREMLENNPKCQIGTVTYETTPKMNKTGNPYWVPEMKSWRVRKRSRVNTVMGSFDYENVVNRARIREGKEANFEAQERQWGEKLACGLVFNKGKYYLSLICLKTIKPHTIYYLDGVEVNDENTLASIKSFIVESKPAVNQELDKDIVYRNVALDNVLQMAIDGQIYDVVS